MIAYLFLQYQFDEENRKRKNKTINSIYIHCLFQDFSFFVIFKINK